MTYRREFTAATKKAAWERAGGVCECGCRRPFEMEHPKGRPHYDHEIPAKSGGDNSLGNCRVIRVDCHQSKTAAQDMPVIQKIRREDKRRDGTGAKKRKIPGSKGTGVRRPINGPAYRVDE